MKLRQIVVAGALLASASPALANQGWVSGVLKFRSQQGNYCDTAAPFSMDCTASRYPASMAVGAQPIRDSEVQLLDENGDRVGLGATDRNGAFTIKWIADATPASIKVRWVLRHFENRFRVVANNDSVYIGDFTTVTPANGKTTAAGTWTWSFTEANNIYDGAQRTWYEAFRYSGVAVSSFTDVRLRWPSSDVTDTNAKASGSSKLVYLATNTAKMPQSRVSHEMGHILSYLAKPFRACVAYNYPTACTDTPGTNCTGPWTLTSSEWYCVSFEEGLATFFGDVSYYWYFATAPTTCTAASPCSDGPFLETSLGSGTAICTTSQKRRAINVDRYVWDAYDTIVDPAYADSFSLDYFSIVGALAEFPTGMGDGQTDEPWSAAVFGDDNLDDTDGRSARDFRTYLGASSSDTAAQYTNNCSPGK